MESLKSNSSIKSSEESALVSIITPTYNHEKFIGNCIESVLEQTYQNWEMIIIDDGSTDKTGTVVSHYKDDRIKYAKQENLGIWRLSETYNKALGMSKGQFVAILEGDDFWPPNKLENQVKIFKNHDIILNWGRRNVVNDKNEIIAFDLQSLEHFKDMPQEELIRNLIIFNFIQPCTVMIDKNALLSIGGFLQPKNTPFVDYTTFLELSLKGKFYPLDEVLGYWRKHGAQVTLKKQSEINAAFMLPVEFYEKLDPSLKNSINFNIDEKNYINDLMLNYQVADSARLDLIKGNWDEALANYKILFGRGGIEIKSHSVIAIICVLFRRNIEWLAVLTCKPKIRDASGEWDSTLFDNSGNLSLLFRIQISILNILQRLRSRPILVAKF